MSRRKKNLGDVFDIVEDAIGDDAPDTLDSSFLATDEALFGSLKAIDEGRQTTQPIMIKDIYPDETQPRRAIPHVVREALDTPIRYENMAKLFPLWEMMVREERERNKISKSFVLREYLDQVALSPDEDEAPDLQEDFPDTIGAVESSLLRLIKLAISIAEEGLANPITIVPRGRQYQIETGERRWLAYQLLYWQSDGDERFLRIAARTVEELNIWRQAAENNARSDLNAISRARQLAVLLMDLIQKNNVSISFLQIDQVGSEHAYYSQVADGTQFRIPRGKSELLLNAIGLKSRKQLREYRALLRLPKQVWKIADDLDWTEYAIREMKSKADDDDALVQLAFEKAATEGYSVPTGTVSAGSTRQPIQLDKSANKKKKEPPVLGTSQYYSYFVKKMNSAKKGEPKAKKEASKMIEEFRRWLDEQEESINQ